MFVEKKKESTLLVLYLGVVQHQKKTRVGIISGKVERNKAKQSKVKLGEGCSLYDVERLRLVPDFTRI